jgi:hypothetical protein
MKTLIAAAAILTLSSGAAMADWEDAWRNPDLSNNFDGHMVTQQSASHDPLEITYRGNSDMYAGGQSGNAFSGSGTTTYDRFVRGNPDIDVCGCI